MLVKSGDICMKFLYNYLTTDHSDTNTITAKAHKMKLLADIFASYGGILAKISQILCIEDGEGSVYSDCKPYSQAKTLENFTSHFESNRLTFFKDVKQLDLDIMKAGSIGQVHKAVYKDDEEIVIKVQYVGLEEQFKTDLKILKAVSDFLFAFIDNKDMLSEITSKLYEELDYVNERTNQETLYNIWANDERIIIPRIIPELCTDTLLASKFIQAEDMFSFIKNSTQEQRNEIGSMIVEFIYTNLFEHQIFYSDIHYGNFLVRDKSKLCVLDFGCISHVEEDFLINIKTLYKSLREDDSDEFYKIVKKMGIIGSKKLSDKSRVYLYDYFKIQFTPYIVKDFEFTEEWLATSTHKEVSLAKEWSLPTNCIFFNKINYGMYHVLTKLQLKVDLPSMFHKIINK
jgi:predicted unusual protein kinase regulating ubiquinone biosynthesis (AarF/ABC1/UbiB family)